jgi:hypothetical protein
MAADLGSWNGGAAKSALLDFVARVTTEGSPDFVPAAARIATFDNDGTLWCEQPLQAQFFFGRHRLEALAQQDPGLRERQPAKAFLEHDMQAVHSLGKKGFFEVVGMSASGWQRRAIPRWTGCSRNWPTGRSRSCWPGCAARASRPSSSRAAAST